MCVRKVKIFICNRCSYHIFVDTPVETECQLKGSESSCGELDQVDYVKCEPTLCICCPDFPHDSSVGFSSIPDYPPMAPHDVAGHCSSLVNNKEREYYIHESSLQKTRKTYLAGATDPAQEERNTALNSMLSDWLARPLELLKLKDPAEDSDEAMKDSEDNSEKEPKDPGENTK